MTTRIIRTDPSSGIVRIVKHTLDKREPKTVVIDPAKRQRKAKPVAVVPKRPQGRPRLYQEPQPYVEPPGTKRGPGRPRKWQPRKAA